MSVKPWAVFTADFPDDQVEDERDILTFGGRNVAVAIGDILARLGCEVSAPEYAGEHGWEFGAWFKRRRVWCLISSFHPIFFLNFDDPPAWGSQGKDAPAYQEIAQKFSATLAEDPRFHDVQWYSREEGPPAPPDSPIAKTPSANLSKDELFAKGLALEIYEPRPPPTLFQVAMRLLLMLGFLPGFLALGEGITLLEARSFWGVVWLPTGVVLLALAGLGVAVILTTPRPTARRR